MTPHRLIPKRRLDRVFRSVGTTPFAYPNPRPQGSYIRVYFALPWLLALFSGCTAQPSPEAGRKDPIEVLVPTEPVTLDPRYATRALDVRLTRLVHAGLVKLNPETLEPEPHLASRIKLEGERLIVIELRPNQRFHDGKPLVADDVCATLSALSDPSLSSPHRSIVESFVNCRVRGPLTLSLEMAQARASWMTDLEVPILRADETRLPQHPDGNLDGLGPFRISARNHSSVVLTPAPLPLAKTPRYPIVVRTIQDENVRAMRMLSGKAEIAPNAFSPTLLAGFHGQPVAVVSRPGANITYLLANGDNSPFDRPTVRRALSLAIDRKLITQELLASFARPAKWLIPEGHWAAPTDLPELSYDKDAARQVLNGLPRATLLTSTDRSRLLQARTVAQMLSDAGLPTDVVPLELGLLLARLDAGQYTLAILQIPELSEPNILRWFFHPRGVASPNEGRNRARYRSATAATLLDQASSELAPIRRRQLYIELARVMLEDMPVIPLWHEAQVAVVQGRGSGFLPSTEGRWARLAEL